MAKYVKKGNFAVNSVDVSVIIPVYNAELYIDQCLNSLLGQSLNNLEVICVDDGSTDSSVEHINNIMQRDKRVTLLRQSNRGAGAARNYGLKRAKGKYVHFLDADDWIDEKAYEKLFNKMEEYNVDVCVFLYTRYDNIKGTERQVKLFPIKNGEVEKTTFQKDYKHLCNTSVVPWNKFYKREYLTKINAWFDEINCANDRSFYYQTIINAGSILKYSEFLIYYRENNSSSLVGQARAKHFDCHLIANKRILSMAAELPIDAQKAIISTNMLDIFSFFKKSDADKKKENFKEIVKLVASWTEKYNLDDFSDKPWYANAKITQLSATLPTDKEVITVVFATNNSYAPFLDVALISLFRNLSPDMFCDVYVFETDLSLLNKKRLEAHSSERYRVNCVNLESKINSLNLYSRAHYSKEMYYRILIPELLYQCDKVIYLDCDLCVNVDITNLFNIDLNDKPLGAVHNCLNNSMFRYVKNMLKINPENYFNSGVLIFNVDEFVKQEIKEKCFDLLKVKENLVCPDQDLLNLACRGNVKLIDSGWNFQWQGCLPNADEIIDISKNTLSNAESKNYITHFTSGKKAWMYPEYAYSSDFWIYAEESVYYEMIKQIGTARRIHSTVFFVSDSIRTEVKSSANKQVSQIMEKQRSYADLENDILNLKNSVSYKIGRFITWLPRKIRDLFKKSNNNEKKTEKKKKKNKKGKKSKTL